MHFDLKLNKSQVKKLTQSLKTAEQLGDFSAVKRHMAILGYSNTASFQQIAIMLQVSVQAIRDWVKGYLSDGLKRLKGAKSPGRPSKLTKAQKKELTQLITKGPSACGFPGACWRTPMIQHLIKEKFGVFYSVIYLSGLLKSMGFSFQKAAFVASKRDKEKRAEWLQTTWPEILKLAQNKNASILFGDEASFPQWGSLNYTWAPVGQQPVVQTSGSRRGYKVFGLIEYFTGAFYSKGHEGKLNGESYSEFLLEVLKKTRKHLILIQDGAPYHKGKHMNEFFKKHADRITVYNLPAYSPDYNPIEKLWKKIKQAGTHLQYFPTFESLICKVTDMLGLFGNFKKEVLSLFGFYQELAVA
ncbi:MAG: IS630 family transposase [Gammaproteobacteria bacterium]